MYYFRKANKNEFTDIIGFFKFNICEYFACMYNLHRSEKCFGLPRTNVIDDCELLGIEPGSLVRIVSALN